jgi:hypothetical protein
MSTSLPASHEGAKMAPFFFTATDTQARSGRMAPIAEEDDARRGRRLAR